MENFIEDVINEFKENITDKVFLMIQNDKKLFHRWLRLIETTKGGRLSVNTSIAKQVKTEFGLDDKTIKDKKKRNTEPKSVLIKSFQEFEK
jgi:hypothetical protein